MDAILVEPSGSRTRLILHSSRSVPLLWTSTGRLLSSAHRATPDPVLQDRPPCSPTTLRLASLRCRRRLNCGCIGRRQPLHFHQCLAVYFHHALGAVSLLNRRVRVAHQPIQPKSFVSTLFNDAQLRPCPCGLRTVGMDVHCSAVERGRHG